MHPCYYCGSNSVRVKYRDQVHKVDQSFGPFNIFTCEQCGSMGTANPPTIERLTDFYQRYDEFRPEWYKSGVAAGALGSQYKFYANHVFEPDGTWADIGAGHGEVAAILSKKNPNGVAIDIGPRPVSLAENVEHLSIDMDRPGWGRSIGRQFDNVFSVAVWEHMLSPGDFARECLSLVAPGGGRLTLICPDYGSLSRKIMRRFWPYFEPGEHISIPTREGAILCLKTACDELNLSATVNAKPLAVGYSIRYLLEVLGGKALASIIPPNLAAPLPTGILSSQVRRL